MHQLISIFNVISSILPGSSTVVLKMVEITKPGDENDQNGSSASSFISSSRQFQGQETVQRGKHGDL
jgi:hypothetical protein